MHTKGPKEEPLADMGYETRDINFKSLGITSAIFFAFALFSFVIVGVWFAWAQPKLGSELDPRKPMPKIQLQSNMAVRSDIQSFRQKETELLSTPGPNEDGSQRIPIDKAMDILAKRGLPHVATVTKAVSPGNTIPQNALQPGEHAPPPTDLIGGAPLGGTLPGQ